MSQEQAIIETKEKRSRAKAKLTTVANQLSRPTAFQPHQLQQLREQLEAAYTSFSNLHHEYAELVADEEYAHHRVVSSLSLDDYLAQANKSYDEAFISYSTNAFKFFSRDANLAIKKAEFIVSQVDKITHNQTSDFSNQVVAHVNRMRELCDQLESAPTSHTAPLVTKLDDLVLSLECIQVRCTSQHTTSDKHSMSNPTLTSLPHPTNTTSPSRTEPSPPSSPHSVASTSASSESNLAASAPSGLPSHESTCFRPGGGSAPTDLRVADQSHTYIPAPLPSDLSIVSMYQGQANQSLSAPLEPELMSNHVSRFKFNKSPLPKFDGDRKSWAEFRSIWRIHAAREFTCDQERAWE